MEKPIQVVVQQPQMGYANSDFKTDTIVQLQEDSLLTVGIRTEIRSGFDSTSNWVIYDQKPGMQNFHLMRGDSLIKVANTDSNWFYQNNAAHFHLSPDMLE